jgi:hypothetical protein
MIMDKHHTPNKEPIWQLVVALILILIAVIVVNG